MLMKAPTQRGLTRILCPENRLRVFLLFASLEKQICTVIKVYVYCSGASNILTVWPIEGPGQCAAAGTAWGKGICRTRERKMTSGKGPCAARDGGGLPATRDVQGKIGNVAWYDVYVATKVPGCRWYLHEPLPRNRLRSG